MEKLFRDIPLFVEVAKQKSLTKAAEALDMPLSTVSRRMLAMEKELALPLFLRSARKIELTDSGRALFERCKFVVSEAGAAFEEVLQNMKSPRGRVRVSLPIDFYHTYLTGAFSSFALQWPDIHLEVHLSYRWADLVTEPYDLDIRIGPLPDSDLIARKICTLHPALFVSPKLFEFYVRPELPADLVEFPCICFSRHGDAWSLSNGEIREQVRVKSVHTVNSMSVGLEFVLAGLGALWLPPQAAAPYEESGELLRLLPEWNILDGGADVTVVTASRQTPKRVRLFIDYLVAHFAEMSGV